MSEGGSRKAGRVPGVVAGGALLLAVLGAACASRQLADAAPAASAADPAAPAAPPARVGVAYESEPPPPGEATEGWRGLEEGGQEGAGEQAPPAAADPHAGHGPSHPAPPPTAPAAPAADGGTPPQRPEGHRHAP